MTYKQVYDKLYATSLTQEQHEKTCNYWFIVHNGAMSHTAFETRAGLDRWMSERGLALESELPEAGTWGTTRYPAAPVIRGGLLHARTKRSIIKNPGGFVIINTRRRQREIPEAVTLLIGGVAMVGVLAFVYVFVAGL
jgi:hypothetical protein